MSYASIDSLQQTLSTSIFAHTKDSKKAAGRALGTIVEIITYYLLREWNLSDSISIERKLKEYGSPDITHNVEFTLHPILDLQRVKLPRILPITATKILRECLANNLIKKNNTLLDRDLVLKNSCVIAEKGNNVITADIEDVNDAEIITKVRTLHVQSYAMFECKRVGVEEGNKKGPQTIEKAKQGAYVAQNTSSLQKIRNENGKKFGLIYQGGKPCIEPYTKLLAEIIYGKHENWLKDFTLSIGIVSNHGNWFTSGNQNKELKVLSQSYDWLLFLSDTGLSRFITDLLLTPIDYCLPIQQAFLSSYEDGKKKNSFTKVKMDLQAHQSLCLYFKKNIKQIEDWFNIITPESKTIDSLKQDLNTLKQKNWRAIL